MNVKVSYNKAWGFSFISWAKQLHQLTWSRKEVRGVLANDDNFYYAHPSGETTSIIPLLDGSIQVVRTASVRIDSRPVAVCSVPLTFNPVKTWHDLREMYDQNFDLKISIIGKILNETEDDRGQSFVASKNSNKKENSSSWIVKWAVWATVRHNFALLTL